MIRNGYPDVYLSFAKYRLYGLSYSMLYGMPVINSLIGAYAVYYALKNKIIYLLMAGIILFSAIINARISIVPIAICFIYMIIILNKNRLTVKNICKTLVGVLAVVFGISLFGSAISRNAIMEDWLTRGFNDIVAILMRNDNGSGYYTYYTSNTMWQLPPNALSVIFGTGNRVIRGNAFYSSDIGYINDIWWGGIIYCLMIYSFLVHELRVIAKNRINSELIFFDGLLLIVLLVVNIKGNVIGLNEITSMITILFVYACVKNKKTICRILHHRRLLINIYNTPV